MQSIKLAAVTGGKGNKDHRKQHTLLKQGSEMTMINDWSIPQMKEIIEGLSWLKCILTLATDLH